VGEDTSTLDIELVTIGAGVGVKEGTASVIATATGTFGVEEVGDCAFLVLG